ncbi:MAG TPA: flavin reductase family protein [Bacteroidales bacterium]|nr:flavin reductase family protein [Bacteroidales bacterium]
MKKKILKPDTMIYPLPAVMVSCGSNPSEYNIITIAWTGTLCTDPPMCYISVRPGRHSYEIIKRNGDFVINLTTKELVRHTDWCGVRSGRDYKKFEETGLTPSRASRVKAPVIMESPVNIECVVKEIKELGVHHMFISEVVAINADSMCFSDETGSIDMNRVNPICYTKGSYYETGTFIGRHGFSVKKGKREGRL